MDDDIDIQRMLEEILRDDYGHNVKTASDGREALGILAGSPPPALVLVDLMMPRMDGAAFIEQKSWQPSFARIPFCVMTASARPDAELARLAAIAERDFPVLRKPFEIQHLLSVVERYC